MQLIVCQIEESSPVAQGWLAQAKKALKGVAEDDIAELNALLQRQFLGLGLIDISEKESEFSPLNLKGRATYWYLTQKGRLQILAVSGLRRGELAQPGKICSGKICSENLLSLNRPSPKPFTSRTRIREEWRSKSGI